MKRWETLFYERFIVWTPADLQNFLIQLIELHPNTFVVKEKHGDKSEERLYRRLLDRAIAAGALPAGADPVATGGHWTAPDAGIGAQLLEETPIDRFGFELYRVERGDWRPRFARSPYHDKIVIDNKPPGCGRIFTSVFDAKYPAWRHELAINKGEHSFVDWPVHPKTEAAVRVRLRDGRLQTQYLRFSDDQKRFAGQVMRLATKMSDNRMTHLVPETYEIRARWEKGGYIWFGPAALDWSRAHPMHLLDEYFKPIDWDGRKHIPTPRESGDPHRTYRAEVAREADAQGNDEEAPRLRGRNLAFTEADMRVLTGRLKARFPGVRFIEADIENAWVDWEATLRDPAYMHWQYDHWGPYRPEFKPWPPPLTLKPEAEWRVVEYDDPTDFSVWAYELIWPEEPDWQPRIERDGTGRPFLANRPRLSGYITTPQYRAYPDPPDPYAPLPRFTASSEKRFCDAATDRIVLGPAHFFMRYHKDDKAEYELVGRIVAEAEKMATYSHEVHPEPGMEKGLNREVGGAHLYGPDARKWARAHPRHFLVDCRKPKRRGR